MFTLYIVVVTVTVTVRDTAYLTCDKCGAGSHTVTVSVKHVIYAGVRQVAIRSLMLWATGSKVLLWRGTVCCKAALQLQPGIFVVMW